MGLAIDDRCYCALRNRLTEPLRPRAQVPAPTGFLLDAGHDPRHRHTRERMRKLVLITTASAALAVAGIAIAHGVNSKSVQAVSAKFTAATASNVRNTTCTGANGHVYATTKASYTGATSEASDPSLNGAVSFDTRSLIDTTTGDGTLSGKLTIAAAGGNIDARFDAVVHGGAIVGLAE